MTKKYPDDAHTAPKSCFCLMKRRIKETALGQLKQQHKEDLMVTLQKDAFTMGKEGINRKKMKRTKQKFTSVVSIFVFYKSVTT